MRKIQSLFAGALVLGAALLPAHAGDLGVSFDVSPHVYVASSGYWYWNGHRHVWVERYDHHDRHYRRHEPDHHYAPAPHYRSHHRGYEDHQRYRKCG